MGIMNKLILAAFVAATTDQESTEDWLVIRRHHYWYRPHRIIYRHYRRYLPQQSEGSELFWRRHFRTAWRHRRLIARVGRLAWRNRHRFSRRRRYLPAQSEKTQLWGFMRNYFRSAAWRQKLE